MAEEQSSQSNTTDTPNKTQQGRQIEIPEVSEELIAAMKEPDARQIDFMPTSPKRPISSIVSQVDQATVQAHTQQKPIKPTEPTVVNSDALSTAVQQTQNPYKKTKYSDMTLSAIESEVSSRNTPKAESTTPVVDKVFITSVEPVVAQTSEKPPAQHAEVTLELNSSKDSSIRHERSMQGNVTNEPLRPEISSIPTLIESPQPTTNFMTGRFRPRIPRFAIGVLFLFIGLGSAGYVAYGIIDSLPPKYKETTAVTYQKASVRVVKDWIKTEQLGIATYTDISEKSTDKPVANAYQFISYIPALFSIDDLTADKKQLLVTDLNNNKDEILKLATFKQNCKIVTDLIYSYQAPNNADEFIRSGFSYTCKQSQTDTQIAKVSGELVISRKGEVISTAIMSNDAVWKTNAALFRSILSSIAYEKSSP